MARSRCDDAGSGISTADDAFVVAALVASEGLAGGERLVADGALVGPATWVESGGGGSGGGIGRILFPGGGGRGKFPVAGFVATECLVRRESFVTYAALVRIRNLIL